MDRELKFKTFLAEQKVNYSAVVLTDDSKEILLSKVTPLHPDVIAHHMTINLGELSPENKKFIGKEVKLRVINSASDDKVQAVGVEQIGEQPKSKNSFPHITISVNREAKGTPYMSNKLTNPVSIEPFELTGIVQEVT